MTFWLERRSLIRYPDIGCQTIEGWTILVTQLETLQFGMNELEPLRHALVEHAVYGAVNSPAKVQTFMEHHVFAVWDFMSLLKRLQNDLTCTAVPWLPKSEPTYARFVNEIVLGEESDEDGAGGYRSHFELYLQAMEESGARVEPIHQFITALQTGLSPSRALDEINAPECVRNFVLHTMDVAMNGGVHQVSAAFFFGREDIIPDMFQTLTAELGDRGQPPATLEYYLNRHIELDGDLHGPLAQKLLAHVCADDPVKQDQAIQTAKKSLLARIELWDGVLAAVSR